MDAKTSEYTLSERDITLLSSLCDAIAARPRDASVFVEKTNATASPALRVALSGFSIRWSFPLRLSLMEIAVGMHTDGSSEVRAFGKMLRGALSRAPSDR